MKSGPIHTTSALGENTLNKSLGRTITSFQKTQHNETYKDMS